MRLFILHLDEPFEPTDVVGIYTTREAAEHARDVFDTILTLEIAEVPVDAPASWSFVT